MLNIRRGFLAKFLCLIALNLFFVNYSLAFNINFYNDTNYNINIGQMVDHDYSNLSSSGVLIPPHGSAAISMGLGNYNYLNALLQYGIVVNGDYLGYWVMSAKVNWMIERASKSFLSANLKTGNDNLPISVRTDNGNYSEYFVYFYYSGNPPTDTQWYNFCDACRQGHHDNKPRGNFIAYYPKGCVGAQCTCIQDVRSGDIWQASGDTSDGNWFDWCSADTNNPGYDAKCASAISNGHINGATGGKLLAQINASGMCGITDGHWHLPTASNKISPNTAITNYHNFNIGNLSVVALANSYLKNNSLADWMNNNGFMNINSNPVAAPYWLANSEDENNAYALDMNTGSITSAAQQGLNYGVILVHENN